MGKKSPDSDSIDSSRRDILTVYRFWLNSLVQNELSPCYKQLLTILWRTEFFAEYKEDEARGEDAKSLRDMFSSRDDIELTNEEYIKLKNTPVRLIEVMIALAQRINDIASTDDDVSKYFWEMVASMEMQKMDDNNYIASNAQKKIDILLGHKYHQNGRGGLFFVKGVGPEYNATLSDLWTQMNVYLNYKRGADI